MEPKRKDGLGLSLLWQVVLLVVCIWIGNMLTNVYGDQLADALNIEFFFGRTMIVVFFAACVAIVGVLVYRGVRALKNR